MAQTFFVKRQQDGGSDGLDGLTAGASFASLQHAHDVANIGGTPVTVNMASGVYSGGAGHFIYSKVATLANPFIIQGDYLDTGVNSQLDPTGFTHGVTPGTRGVQHRYFTFRNLNVGGQDNFTDGPFTNCWFIYNSSFFTWENCYSWGSGSHVWQLGGSIPPSAESVHHCNWFDCISFKAGRGGTTHAVGWRIGQRGGSWAQDCLFERCVSHSNNSAIGAFSESGTGFNVNSPGVNNTNEPIVDASGRKTRDITFRHCVSYNNGSTGVSTQLPQDVTFEDCLSFWNNRLVTTGGEGYGFRAGFNNERIYFIRCTAWGNRFTGFDFQATGSVITTSDDYRLNHCLAYLNGQGPGASGQRQHNVLSEGFPIRSINNVSWNSPGTDMVYPVVSGEAHNNFIGDGNNPTNDTSTLSGTPDIDGTLPVTPNDIVAGMRYMTAGPQTEHNGGNKHAVDLTSALDIINATNVLFAATKPGNLIDAGAVIPDIGQTVIDAAPDIGPQEIGETAPPGPITGTATVSTVTSGTILGNAPLTGISTVDVSMAAGLSLPAMLTGSMSVSVTTAGTFTSTGSLTGNATVSVAMSAVVGPKVIDPLAETLALLSTDLPWLGEPPIVVEKSAFERERQAMLGFSRNVGRAGLADTKDTANYRRQLQVAANA